jgi:hypothetical protein
LALLDEVWSLLRQVQSLRFEARSEAGTGWDGVGVGTVRVTEPADGVIVFDETGTWQVPGGAVVRFTNVFRWTASGGQLRLEHLRMGADQPVFLFDLVPGEDGEWRQASPHQCREDCYTASLKVVGRQLLVAWSVQGPRKRESIRYAYW